MKTILVLTDYSESANNALTFACNLAQKMEASIVLYHSFFLPVADPELPVHLPTADELKAENSERLQQLARQTSEAFNLKVDYHTDYASLSNELNQIVKQFHAHMVVLGRKQAKDWEYTLFGSTAALVLRHCSYPVLIVPEGVSFRPFSHLLFACDYQYIVHEEKLKFLKEFASLFQAQIRVLHIEKPASAKTTIGKNKQHFNLEVLFSGIRHQYTYIENEDILSGIQEGVEQYQADLLVTIPKVHTFWEVLRKKSITRKLLFQTSIPLLAIPD